MSAPSFLAVFVAFVTLSIPCYAQIERPLAWLRDLAALENEASSSLEYRRAEVTTIRKEIEEWTALHSGKAIDLRPASEAPWTGEQLREEIDVLTLVVENLIRDDPSHPFYLGTTVVNVTTSAAALSPVSDSMDQTEVRNRAALTVKDAIEYLPGVSVDHKVPRNQRHFHRRNRYAPGAAVSGWHSGLCPI